MSAKKVFGLRVFLFFFDYRKKKEFNLEKTKKILFLHPRGFIGDAIVSTGIYKTLKEQGFEVDILASSKNKVIFDINKENLNKIFLFKEGLINFFKIALTLRKENYDLLIELNSKITRLEFLFIKIIKAKSVLSYDKRAMNLLNISMLKLHPEINFDTIHITNKYKYILNFLNIESQVYLKYSLPLSLELKNEVRKFLEKEKISRYICLAPYASSEEKNMSKQQIKELYTFLNENYSEYKIIFLGLAKELEELKIYKNALIYPFEDFTCSIELIKNCKLLITTDTSFTHVASAFEKNTIILYRNLGSSKKWAPNNINAKVLFGNQKDSIQDIRSDIIIEEINYFSKNKQAF